MEPAVYHVVCQTPGLARWTRWTLFLPSQLLWSKEICRQLNLKPKISCWHDFCSRISFLWVSFHCGSSHVVSLALKKWNKGKKQRKNLCPHLENHCRAPSSLKVEGFPVAPGRSEGVWGQGSARPPHYSFSALLSTRRALLGKGSRFPIFWDMTQTTGFLPAFSLLLSFLSSLSSGYQSVYLSDE